MTDTQQRDLRALEMSHSLAVGGDALVEKWIVHGVHGDPSDIAVSFEWSDERGYVWGLDFTEQSLAEAKIDGNRIRMVDSEGEEAAITVFQLEPVRV